MLAVVLTLVLKVNVELTALFDPFAVSEVGLKEQDVFGAVVEQVSLIVPL